VLRVPSRGLKPGFKLLHVLTAVALEEWKVRDRLLENEQVGKELIERLPGRSVGLDQRPLGVDLLDHRGFALEISLVDQVVVLLSGLRLLLGKSDLFE